MWIAPITETFPQWSWILGLHGFWHLCTHAPSACSFTHRHKGTVAPQGGVTWIPLSPAVSHRHTHTHTDGNRSFSWSQTLFSALGSQCLQLAQLHPGQSLALCTDGNLWQMVPAPSWPARERNRQGHWCTQTPMSTCACRIDSHSPRKLVRNGF